MSKTTTELLATIAANFPDNTSQQITPALLRAYANDAVTSFAYGIYANSNTTTQAGAINYCDTSAGPFSLTLPTSPAVGNIIAIRDLAGTWGTNNLSLLPGSNSIESVAGTFVCNTSDANFDLVWRGGGIGWSIQFINIGGVSRIETSFTPGVLGIQGRSTVSFVSSQLATVAAFAMAGVSGVIWHNAGPAVTWNASDKSANVALSGGNLTATGSAALGHDALVRATVSRTDGGVSGGYYFEVTSPSNACGVGIVRATQDLNNYFGNSGGVEGIGYYPDGHIVGFTNLATVDTFTTGDVIGVLLEATTLHLIFYKNGVRQGAVGPPPQFFGPLSATDNFPAVDCGSSGVTVANFGASAFSFLPAGATGWSG